MTAADGGAAGGRERVARAFVWAVWLTMAIVALGCLIRYVRNLPQTEDWYVVPAVTGNDPDFFGSLWAQNNEHRVPLPRLVLIGAIAAAHGDFRAGAVLSIAILTALAAGLIALVRRLRGRTIVADAFFPLALLHLGNWENLFWSWQLTLILASVLVLVLMGLMISDPRFTRRGSQVAAAASLVALPLSGATGIVFGPILAAWIGYRGWVRWRGVDAGPGAQRDRLGGGLLVGAAVACVALAGLYFVGYHRPSWIPPNPGPLPSLVATGQFLAMGFGPVARSSWLLSIAGACLVLFPTVGIAVRAAIRASAAERPRALGLAVLVGAFGAFAVAMGWGRAGVIPIYKGWPIRYSLLAAPAFIVAFLVWELYGGPAIRRIGQTALLVAMIALAPFNAAHGFRWAKWVVQGQTQVSRDLARHVKPSVMAARHGKTLSHALPVDELASMMVMLKDARLDPWVRLGKEPRPLPRATPSPAARELVDRVVVYRGAGVTEASLVWGIDGWRPMPEAAQPSRTVVKARVMHTEMEPANGHFEARIRVPKGATMDYGFVVTLAAGDSTIQAWDGGHRADGSSPSPLIHEPGPALRVELAAEPSRLPLATERIRYRLPDAGRVYLNARVTVAPVGGAEPKPGRWSRLPMEAEGGVFETAFQAPVGATVDYGFSVTDRVGILNLMAPIEDWANRSQVVSPAGDVVDVVGGITIPHDWRDARAHWRLFGASGLLAMLLWAGLYTGFGSRRPR